MACAYHQKGQCLFLLSMEVHARNHRQSSPSVLITTGPLHLILKDYSA